MQSKASGELCVNSSSSNNSNNNPTASAAPVVVPSAARERKSRQQHGGAVERSASQAETFVKNDAPCRLPVDRLLRASAKALEVAAAPRGHKNLAEDEGQQQPTGAVAPVAPPPTSAENCVTKARGQDLRGKETHGRRGDERAPRQGVSLSAESPPPLTSNSTAGDSFSPGSSGKAPPRHFSKTRHQRIARLKNGSYARPREKSSSGRLTSAASTPPTNFHAGSQAGGASFPAAAEGPQEDPQPPSAAAGGRRFHHHPPTNSGRGSGKHQQQGAREAAPLGTRRLNSQGQDAPPSRDGAERRQQQGVIRTQK